MLSLNILVFQSGFLQLLSFIPKMIEGTDKQSYKLTLAEISVYLHDAHVDLEERDEYIEEAVKYILGIR